MKLVEYLKKHNVNKLSFCRKIGISAPALYGALEGRDMKLSTAIRIVKETYGEVKFSDLLDPKYLETMSIEGKQRQQRRVKDVNNSAGG